MATHMRAVFKSGRVIEGDVIVNGHDIVTLLVKDPDCGMEAHVEKDRLRELVEVFPERSPS